MKQKKISYWLKGLDIVLALMVLTFFVGATYAKIFMPDFFYKVDSIPAFIAFAWFTAICIFIVLFEFWRICTQIGQDNSFSMENSKSFHHMTVCGVAAAIGFFCRIIWIIASQCITPFSAIVLSAEIVLSLMFAILAEALSKLVLNAYEMKHENDLTI